MIDGIMNNSPIREVKSKVELYEGSTLLHTFTYRDKLTSFNVERVGESSKFFGFGICQKLEIELIDDKRELNITTDHSFRVYLTTGDEYQNLFPPFYVKEVNRDENTNALSIIAYDKLYDIKKIPFDFEIIYQYFHNYVDACARILDLPKVEQDLMLDGEVYGQYTDVKLPTPNIPITDAYYVLLCKGQINLEGTETVKDILDAAADAAQAIYYLDKDENLTMKRLDRDGDAVLTISKSDYFTLKAKTPRTLAHIVSTNDLNDNVPFSIEDDGLIQYVRNNLFWDLRDDREDMVDYALSKIGGITIYPIECEWRGNFLLEIGDKVNLITKDDETIVSYILEDKIEYSGGLKEETIWRYDDTTTNQTDSTPSTLGEAIKQTIAKVDKANGRIELLASNVEETKTTLGDLSVSAESIDGRVTSVEQLTNENNEEIATLTQTVETKMTSEEVSIKITSALQEGVDKVKTSEKGFTFDDAGLKIADSDSEMSTQISEDGMVVYKNNDPMLTANNQGVEAQNLQAKKYLIIDSKCRFEEYGSGRIGCFWIGG